ncbi:hypothetical protein [Bartonella sp. A05]|uniref:hypothetical protein n=1 Tax=Bartonella sp. A05 TaxID=2967261 RepID=UPI0022A9F3F0|nr:hypothetical protein [Bartonella sp. A05]MCZ2204433.1 hypothetical protein [Bartonella sp. A05]
MKKERILIAVKTYPTLSKKYTELVCTAGFREDGSWIRLYPSPFRFLEESQRYKKYQWIELEIGENPTDHRPESYRPLNIDDITLGDCIPTDRNWEERRKFIFANNTVHTNLETIIEGAKSNQYSLVIFKPKQIKDFVVEAVNREWELSRKEAIEAALKQGSLFEEHDKQDFKLMPKLPYKFSYRFTDDEDKESTLMIEDWEIGQLYWNCLNTSNSEKEAIDKVKQKYFDDFALTKDIYLFLGTTYEWHKRAKNPYVIIGVFYPKKIIQESLF